MEQQNILSLSLKEYREQIDSLKEALSKLNEESSDYSKILSEARDLQDALIQTLTEAEQYISSVSNNVSNLSDNLSNLGDINIEFEQLNGLDDELSDIIYDIDEIQKKQIEVHAERAEIDDLQSSLEDVSKNGFEAAQSSAEAFSNSINDINSTADPTLDTLSNLKKEISDMKSKLDNLEIGSDAFNQLAEKIKTAQERLAGLKDQMGDNADSVLTLSKSMTSAFSDMGLGLGGLENAFNVATVASNGFKTALDLLKAHPIIAVITILLGILLKIKSAFEKNEEASDAWSFAMAAFQPIIDAFNRALGWLAEGLAKVAQWLGEHLPSAIKAVSKPISSLVKGVGTLVKAFLFLPTVVAKVFDKVTTFVKNGVEAVTGTFAKLADAVGLDGLANSLRNVTKTISNFSINVGGALESFAKNTKSWFDNAGNAVYDFGKKWAATTESYIKKAKEMDEVEDSIREQQVRNAESALKVAELRKKAAEETDPKKRLEILKQVDAEIVKNGKEQVQLAKRQYELAKWYADQAPNSEADNDRLAQLKANVAKVEATYTNSLIKIAKQETAIQTSLKKSAETKTKAEKAEADKQVKELMEAEKEKLRIANEYVKNFNETIKNLQTESSQQTKVIKSEEDIAKSLGVLSPEKQKEFENRRYETIKASNDKILAEYQTALEADQITEEQKLQIQTQYSNKLLDIIIVENEHKANINKITLEEINKNTEKALQEQSDLYKNNSVVQQYTEAFAGLKEEVQQKLVADLSVDEETKAQILESLSILNEDMKEGTSNYDLQVEEQEHEHQLRLLEIKQEAAEQLKEQFGPDSEEYLNARMELNQLEEDEELRHAEAMGNIHRDMDNNQKKSVETQIKSYTQLAKSTAGLFGTISDIMQNNIDEKVKNGEISEEEAKKEFERVKKIQIAETIINTLAGAAGGLLQGIENYPPPFGAIIGGATAATALASGYAQVQQIKQQEYGSTSAGGGSAAGVSTVDFQSVSVNPLLDEERDLQGMTSLNVNGDSETQEQNQRVYILQSDLVESGKQVAIRQAQITF